MLAEIQDNAETSSAQSKAETAPALRGLDESAFSIVSERNIFNANRSGGQVRLTSRRAASVESFTLVGTMAYEKGTFAFFDGTSSDYTKALKADNVIAGHKVVSIQTSSVKLEADGKQFELPVGSQMRREDGGLWRMAEATSGNGGSSSSSGYSSSGRSGRSGRGESSFRSRRNGGSSNGNGDSSESTRQSTSTTENSSDNSNTDEILKRLMERREKESQ